jgi:hypothetical protein
LPRRPPPARSTARWLRNDNGFVAQNDDFRQWRGFLAPHFRPAGQPFGINEISPTLELEHAQARSDGATIMQAVHPGVASPGRAVSI